MDRIHDNHVKRRKITEVCMPVANKTDWKCI